jgi:hypothetical protein
MKDKQLTQLAKEYQNLGVVHGSALLLRPIDALRLLQQLAELRILVTSCNCWRYVNGGVVQDYLEYSPLESIPLLELTPEQSALMIADFLATELPPNIDLVSFYFDDPQIGELLTIQI